MNIDFAIVVIYMVATMIVGYKYGKGVRTIEDYAIGGRNFSTATLASTIIATSLSGSWFIVSIQNSYNDGIIYFLANIGNILNSVIIAYFLAPRMKEFLGKMSLPDAVGELYGEIAKQIVSVSGIIVCIGFVAVQFKILSALLSYFSGIPLELSIILSALVVITYCMFGGVRAVIFTDVLQFAAFTLAMMPIFIGIYGKIDFDHHPEAIKDFFNHAFAFSQNGSIDYFTWFFYGLIPGFSLSMFQRIGMAKSTEQISKAFYITAFAIGVFLFISSLIGLMLHVYDANLDPSHLLGVIINKFSLPGLKGIIVVAVLAMAMSTLDSHLNSASVVFSHDICGYFKFAKSENVKLLISRVFVFIAGIIAMIIAIKFQELIQIIFFAVSFYNPIVTPIMLLTIFGFRPKSHIPALAGMGAGFFVSLFWRICIQPETGFEPLIPGMLMNVIFFMGSHYIFGFEGGWIGPKDKDPLEIAVLQRERKWEDVKLNLIGLIRILSWVPGNILNIRAIPSMQALLGILIIASYFSVAIFNPLLSQNITSLYFLQISSCITGAFLITSHLWSNLIISSSYLGHIVIYSLIYLIYSNAILMFYHGFSSISVISLFVNVLACSFFCRTFISVIVMLIGCCIAAIQYRLCGHNFIFSDPNISALVSYGSFALAFVLLPFMDRQNTQIETLIESETKLRRFNEMLNSQVALREENLRKSMDMQNEILKNVNHEIRTPMSVLRSNTDLLAEEWHESSFQKNMGQVVAAIKSSVDRFYIYASNMLDLSEYRSDKMLFDIKQHSFKNFLGGIAKEHENIILNYDSAISEEMEFDELKMRRLFEELIRNSNNSNNNNSGIIKISVEKTKNKGFFFNSKFYDIIEISVKDLGVGIPEDELESVFEPFKLSSRTKTNAGGRGMGLALVKEIVRGHRGQIYAKNNAAINEGEKGISICISLPLKHPKDEFLGDAVHIDDRALEEIDLGEIIKQIRNLEKKFNGRIPKILMIDDQVSMISSGSMLVKSLGYEFMGVSTGLEAVKYILSEKFDADIVLLDMMLGDITGLEIMKQTHERLAEKGVPVIIQSGSSPEDVGIADTLKLGVKTVINKPYSRDQIRGLLQKYLED